ncbi:MAG: AAA family ATPase, partial [Euryarchaeota archaeon]|nr:AAA family ATPase [Euryarchaeota archaeon]
VLGVQRSVVIGIFESLRKIGGEVGTVVIEEPEMYLHPQAQRYFYRLLRDLADKQECQIIYSTHSPIFADITRFEGLRVCRKPIGQMTSVSYVSQDQDAEYLASQRAAQRLEIGFDPASSELLFAKKALLVEGPGDKLATLRTATNLHLDIDGEGLSVVPCGGKNAIPFYVRACRAFDIPYVVMYDRDVFPIPSDADTGTIAKISAENEQAERETQVIVDAVEDPELLFVLDPSLEEVLGIGRTAKDKPRRVVAALDEIDVTSYPTVLKEAVNALFTLRS